MSMDKENVFFCGPRNCNRALSKPTWDVQLSPLTVPASTYASLAGGSSSSHPLSLHSFNQIKSQASMHFEIYAGPRRTHLVQPLNSGKKDEGWTRWPHFKKVSKLETASWRQMWCHQPTNEPTKDAAPEQISSLSPFRALNTLSKAEVWECQQTSYISSAILSLFPQFFFFSRITFLVS